MKLRAIIIIIVVYVLVAFGWLTYSLLNYSDNEFQLRNDVLKAGLNACVLQVVEGAKNHKLGSDSSYTYYLKDLQIDVDPEQLQQFINKHFQGDYLAYFQQQEQKVNIDIRINPIKLQEVADARMEQKQLWLFQSLILMILVGAGVYGVFYSINSIFRLNKQQNNFLLSVTHEFKTPIASIRLLLQTLQNPKIKEEMKPPLIDKAVQNTFRLEELTENMLTATQMEYDKYEYNRMKFNYSELLQKIILNHSVKGEINQDIEENIYVHGDEFILRIAISNLVANAFKYSEQQPIDITLQQGKKFATLQIKDRGVGIPKGEHKRIFNKFYRVQDEETRTTIGTGLGLFIAKRAITNHNGTVEASDNEPKGSIFTVNLPL